MTIALSRLCIALSGALCCSAHAQKKSDLPLQDVVVSASRVEQRRFDAPAAIDAVTVDTFRAASPLVNLSELLGSVPGIQVRERQNYAQDLQLSVRGFGTRSTFGVRGVRILIDGIPATMPDGQGQAATASLASVKRIEVLRGPLAQLYGNAAGGVVQILSKDAPTGGVPEFGASLGLGSDGQRREDASFALGGKSAGGLLDVSHYATAGYRDHSAARRTQMNAKLQARPDADTDVAVIVNRFDQPLSQDPLGLTHAAFNRAPMTVTPEALAFDTRKTIQQAQSGVTLVRRFGRDDTLNARLYYGTRHVFQTLALSGAALTSSGGVVDLDRDYGGAGLNWVHESHLDGRLLRWTIGFEADRLRETRRGYVNTNGVPGALRRDEDDSARNRDFYVQADWAFAPRWQAIAGVRNSRVQFGVADHFINANSPDDSGAVAYRNTSPVLGLVWHQSEAVNWYANAGRGFETPTLAESAYRVGGSGPNFSLKPSTSTQVEVGIKMRVAAQSVDAAMFDARSRDEITPQGSSGGRAIFQNVDRVERRGVELAWRADWTHWRTQVGYTWLDAHFDNAFSNGAGIVAAGKTLPGAPAHSLFASLEAQPLPLLTTALEMRLEGRAFVDDANSDAAPGYAVVNLRAGYEWRAAPVKLYLFARLDNILDKKYAGSVIVNDGNSRFFEPAAGRRVFAGVRSLF